MEIFDSKNIKKFGLTIDSATSLDLDDAIWCQKDSDGNYFVTVFVTNITDIVAKDSDLDQTAFHLTSTEYLANRAIEPMIPHAVTAQGSLLPHQTRPTLAVEMKFDGKTFAHLETIIELTEFESLGRLSYPEAAELTNKPLFGKFPESFYSEELFPVLKKLSKVLAEKRRMRGSLSIFFQLDGWEINEDMQLKRLNPDKQNIGYVIIQEFAILANNEISTFAETHQIPILFRNHQIRFSEEIEGNSAVRQLLVAELVNYIKREKQLNPGLLQTIIKPLRSGMVFERANYHPKNTAHMGLALEVYGHHTSPLRRYADLVNQRQLTAYLGNKDILPYSDSELEEIANRLNTVNGLRQSASNSRHLEMRETKRIKIIKDLNERDSRNTLVNLPEGEFNKTVEIWLKTLNLENKNEDSKSATKLLEIIGQRIAENTLQPKLAVFVLTFGMSDHPRKLSEVGSAENANSEIQELCRLILGWMAEDSSRALTIWNMIPSIFPESTWTVPQFTLVQLNLARFECVAEITLKNNEKLSARGSASQKQQAKALAALNLWFELKGIAKSDSSQTTQSESNSQLSNSEQIKIFTNLRHFFSAGNFKAALNELTARAFAPDQLFDYKVTESIKEKQAWFKTKISLQFANLLFSAEGDDFSKKRSENLASKTILGNIARELSLDELRQFFPQNESLKLAVNTLQTKNSNHKMVSLPEVVEQNYIGAIETFFRRINQPVPQFRLLPKITNDPNKLWEIELFSVSESHRYQSTGKGASINQARRNAAQRFYEKLKQEFPIVSSNSPTRT